MNKDYQPIPMRPLTMRGVFGITWGRKAALRRWWRSA